MVDLKAIMDDIAYRAENGAKKYGPMDSNQLCLGALTLEVAEVHEAIQERKDWKVREELLDVATVCVRRAAEIDAKHNRTKQKR